MDNFLDQEEGSWSEVHNTGASHAFQEESSLPPQSAQIPSGRTIWMRGWFKVSYNVFKWSRHCLPILFNLWNNCEFPYILLLPQILDIVVQLFVHLLPHTLRLIIQRSFVQSFPLRLLAHLVSYPLCTKIFKGKWWNSANCDCFFYAP